MNRTVQRTTHSVCPVCLHPLPAVLVTYEGPTVYLEKTCPVHGSFAVPVWRGYRNLTDWRGCLPEETSDNLFCPQNCADGICKEHLQGTCCALLEVTSRCNLQCTYCFATNETAEPTLLELKAAVEDIFIKGNAPLLQLSGGEPTLRDDLPELVAYARSLGFPYIQLNTNGIRLATDETYVRSLAEAGLSFVFLQFDGIKDSVFRALRKADLLETKIQAIDMCDRYHIGVTLVPTVVRGINNQQLGDLVRFAASKSPAVRGVHFQPVSYFGRIPAVPTEEERYTLDELIHDLTIQTGIPEESLRPSHCDHPMCGFHGTFLANLDGTIRPLQLQLENECCCCQTTAKQNRDYVGVHWTRTDDPAECCHTDPNTLDGFLQNVRTHSFTLTAMAFQDAMNLDIERLRRCSLHVYNNHVLKPFCAHYITPFSEEKI